MPPAAKGALPLWNPRQGSALDPLGEMIPPRPPQ